MSPNLPDEIYKNYLSMSHAQNTFISWEYGWFDWKSQVLKVLNESLEDWTNNQHNKQDKAWQHDPNSSYILEFK